MRREDALDQVPAEELAGTIGGRFAIRARLGAGGMGEVYRAEDLRLRRSVAIKRLSPQLAAEPGYHERFLKEGQRASGLNNPHIASVYDVVEDRNELYLVMEYIQGITLRERLRKSIELGDFLDIGIQCADALEAAHEKGLVHGDVKPENIMLTPNHQVKILDFGVARRLRRAAAGGDETLATIDAESGTLSRPTLEPGLSGTPAYMAPEVMLEKPVDGRADIFGLGVVFYEMLSGRNPFQAVTFLETSARVIHETPAALTTTSPEVPAEVEGVIARMLAKDPEGRYATAAEVRSELQKIQELRAAGRLGRRRWRAKPWRRYGIAAAALAVLLALAGLIVMTWRGAGAKPGAPAPPATQQLVVLPFDAIGGDARLRAFADGLTETLTGKLTQLTDRPTLGVYPSSEVRGHDVKTVEQAQKEFGVNLVLTGSLESAGQAVRVTAVLIDARTRRQVASETVTASQADVFDLEDEVVSSSVRMLGIQPRQVEQETLAAHGTTQPAAYNDYLLGRGYAREFEKAEGIERAIQAYNRSVQEDPGFGLAYAGLGEAYWHKYLETRDNTWVDLARASCRKANSLKNGGAEAFACLGLLDNGTGEYSAAAQEFKRALDLEPTDDHAYLGLGKALEELGRFSEAEQTYQQAIARRPNYGASCGWLGNFYYRRGRFQDATRLFKEMVDLTPDSFVGYSNLGGAYLMQGRYEDAIAALKRSVEIRPTYYATSNLGTAYYDLRRYAEAARTYEQATALDGKEYDLWGNLGDAYYWAPGDRERAPAAYQKALALARSALQVNPHDSTLLGYAATYEAMLGDRNAALGFLGQAARLAPKDPELMFNAALVHNQFGENEEALSWLARAVAAGYPTAALRDTPNFDRLRTDRRFKILVEHP